MFDFSRSRGFAAFSQRMMATEKFEKQKDAVTEVPVAEQIFLRTAMQTVSLSGYGRCSQQRGVITTIKENICTTIQDCNTHV